MHLPYLIFQQASEVKPSFSYRHFFLEINAPLIHDNLFVATIEGAEQSPGVDTRFGLRAREAYVDMVSLFDGLHALRAGLIPQPWQKAQYEIWPYRFLGRDAWSLTEKWNYQSPSDLGISFMSELPYGLGEWALTAVNGEGINRPEGGRNKEASLFLRFAQGGSWSLSTSYARGNYDGYERDISVKERIQALLAYEGSTWLAGLEYFGSQDPANALQDFSMAEGVDVLDFLGTETRGEGGSAFVSVSTGESSDLMFRYDFLNPIKDEEGRDLHTFLTAWGWTLTEGVKTAFVVDYTRYGDNYGLGARDRSKLSLATQVLF